MATISERLNKALQIRNMKQTELVQKTGIGKSSISTYLTGAYEPKQKNLYKIAKALNVDVGWLMGLNVPMEINNTTMSEMEIASIIKDIYTDEELQKEINLFNNLTPENKKTIIDLMIALSLKN